MDEKSASFGFERDVSSVPRARAFVTRWFSSATVPPSESDDLALAASEANANACRHSNAPSASLVRVSCRRDVDQVIIDVVDGGDGFDVHEEHQTDPSVDATRGRGLFLMEQLMDEVKITTTEASTQVSLTRRLTKSSVRGR